MSPATIDGANFCAICCVNPKCLTKVERSNEQVSSDHMRGITIESLTANYPCIIAFHQDHVGHYPNSSFLCEGLVPSLYLCILLILSIIKLLSSKFAYAMHPWEPLVITSVNIDHLAYSEIATGLVPQ